MKISVAMATYNGMRFIEKQLDSIREQFLLPDEVIICDDCSTDGTADFINEYIERYSLFGWKLFRNSENLGFKRNFLLALSKTQGDIVFLCDQDDLWQRDKTEKMSRIMEQNSGIFALSSSFTFINENDTEINKSGEALNHGLINIKNAKSSLISVPLRVAMHSNISPGCTAVVRKELINLFCEKSDSVLPHDWEINIVAAAKQGLYFLNQSLSFYRIHSSNALGLDSAAKDRIGIGEEKLSAAVALCRYYDYSHLCSMQKKRLFALKNKKPFEILSLIFTSREYARYYSFKERVGDFVFTLR
ncbi:MAG: glycosyltransferase family 2 protein [Clostridia bacterium]|nr:glycosyltransferase family 2 protein [Clostridia bacterium]